MFKGQRRLLPPLWKLPFTAWCRQFNHMDSFLHVSFHLWSRRMLNYWIELAQKFFLYYFGELTNDCDNWQYCELCPHLVSVTYVLSVKFFRKHVVVQRNTFAGVMRKVLPQELLHRHLPLHRHDESKRKLTACIDK